MLRNQSIEIGNQVVHPGEHQIVMLAMPKLYDCSPVYLPIHVVCGRTAGPTLVVLAAVHGDEINGVEIVRRLLKLKALNRIHGTLIAIPVVNVYGFIYQSRYLMDRRDLNRSFPGSSHGSLTGRLANFLTREIMAKATHIIDLHTGSLHRTNVPQIRASLNSKKNKELASAFGAPVILHSKQRDGSLRQAMSDRKIPYILYEAGEALRFDEVSIRTGLHGILSCMRHLEMIRKNSHVKHHCVLPSFAYKSIWIRSPVSGMMMPKTKLGQHVNKGDILAMIANPLSLEERPVKSSYAGIVIGKTNLPLIHEGEALFHVARVNEPVRAHREIMRLKNL